MSSILSLTALVLIFTSCVGDKLDLGDGMAPIKKPALSSTYTSGSAVNYTKDSAITTNTITNSGSPITTCTVSPPLPAGLSINQTTCAISGTPTAVTASRTYTITASNIAGSTISTITIAVNDVAPILADYSSASASYNVNSAITANTSTNSGGTITGCTCSPSLPAGLSLDTTSCSISGTPTAITASQTYTITATNSGGSVTKTLTIVVNDAAPALANYSTATASYPKDAAITANTSTNSGGTISSCTVSPTLPAGLALNTTTCTISGTPTVAAATATYTITATNSQGTSTKTLSITVTPTVSISNLVNNGRINSGFIIGTVPSAAGVSSIEVSIDGGAYAAVTGTTSWEYQLPTGANTWRSGTTYNFKVRSQDAAGNYSAVTSVDIKKGKNTDFNGDGYGDFFEGADGYATPGLDAGIFYIFHGSDTGIGATDASEADTAITADAAGDFFGLRNAVGDINADGYADVAVAATGYNNVGASQGAVYVYYGSANGLADGNAEGSADIMIEGETAGDYLGGNVDIGDLDGNGFDDLVIASYQYPAGVKQGRVYIFYSDTIGISDADLNGGDTADKELTGVAVGPDGPNMFGSNLAIGDVNGDGYGDLAVGSQEYNGGLATSQGAAHIFHGSDSGIPALVTGPATADTEIIGEGNDDSLGTALTAANINGDAYCDIIIGASGYDGSGGGAAKGRAYIFLGASGGINDTDLSAAEFADATLTGEADGDTFAVQLAAGDINSDGYSDLIIGAEAYNAGTNQGRTYVFLGSTNSIATAAATSANIIFTGETAADLFGTKLQVSNVNGDGYPDLILGAEQYLGGVNTGREYIFFGSSSWSTSIAASSADEKIDGENAGDYF